MNSVEKPFWKKIISFGMPIIGLFFVFQSVKSLYSLWRRGDIVDKNLQVLQKLEKEQEILKKDLSYSSTASFIEEEARNKLGLVKPGETIVYVEKEATKQGDWKLERDKNQEESILRQWWELFF